jgi:hypothetical protein
MNEISSGVAFWILEAWRKMDAQLHLASLNTTPSSSPAKVWRTSPSDSSVWMVVRGDNGQNKELETVSSGCYVFFRSGRRVNPIPRIDGGSLRLRTFG